MNSRPSSSTPRFPLNSMICLSGVIDWLASTTPMTVTATSPASDWIRSAAAEITMTAASATERCSQSAERGAGEERPEQVGDGDTGPLEAPGQNHFERENGDHGAYRIDDDPLPAEHGRHRPRGPHLLQEGEDDRRTRDDEDSAQEGRGVPVKPQD